jgi:hypothetical protein
MVAEPVLGSQVPRIQNIPKAFTTKAGREAIELASIAGLKMDPWQRYVLNGAMGQRQGGRWAAPEVGLVVSRQSGKGSIVEAASLAGMYLHNEEIVYTAHLMSTSRKMRLRIQKLIESTPDLDAEVKQIRTSNEEQSIALKSGARIDFVARSSTGARGWSAAKVFLDEAFALSPEMIGALMPIIIAQPNWQLWYVSMAGMMNSTALRRVRERGIDRDPGLAYFEWSAEEEAYRKNPEAVAVDLRSWKQSIPALGIRIDLETIATLQRSMDEAEFAREILGIWDDPRGDILIDPLQWASLADKESEIIGGMVFALDVEEGLSSSAIAAAGRNADKVPHVEITGRGRWIDHRPGVEWVVPRVVKLQEQWASPVWVMDPTGPAGALLADLREAGIEPVLVSGQEWAQACGEMLKLIIDPDGDKLRHHGQKPLAAAVSVVKKRDIGDGGWAFGRRVSDEDISPLNAATLALHGLTVYGDVIYDVLASVH